MKKYTPPKKEFLMLPNSVFDMPLDVYAFKIYAYLVCCAGSRGECWPTMHKMSTKLGIAVSTVQDRSAGKAEADCYQEAQRYRQVQEQHLCSAPSR